MPRSAKQRTTALTAALAAAVLLAEVSGCGDGAAVDVAVAKASNPAPPPAESPAPTGSPVSAEPDAVAEASAEASQPSEPSTTDAAPSAEPASESPPANDAEPAEAYDGRLLIKSFDDIKFDIEPDAPFFREMLTEPIEDLAGKRIRIRGWILPTFRNRGIKQFVLVRDNQECCFGPGAALYDCILVEMLPGRTTEFSTKSVAVEGRFAIEEFRLGDRVMAIYKLEGEKVDL
ncbi:MAG: hypothetical protein AAGJ46_03985 [Planctomycetota bacterium]